MSRPDTATVAALLREYGERTALRGGNPYRAKAYRRAAESLGALTVPLDQLIREGRLAEILPPGSRINAWAPHPEPVGTWRGAPSAPSWSEEVLGSAGGT